MSSPRVLRLDVVTMGDKPVGGGEPSGPSRVDVGAARRPLLGRASNIMRVADDEVGMVGVGGGASSYGDVAPATAEVGGCCAAGVVVDVDDDDADADDDVGWLLSLCTVFWSRSNDTLLFLLSLAVVVVVESDASRRERDRCLRIDDGVGGASVRAVLAVVWTGDPSEPVESIALK
jgi:hypothetical protein